MLRMMRTSSSVAAHVCFRGRRQWRWWTVKGAYKWTATHGENHPTLDVYCTGAALCETVVFSKYFWYVYMWLCTILGGGAMWSGWNAAKKQKKTDAVCVCALSRWMYSRSGCLSELKPDRCGSNLRQYDVIDYLIFWGPAHRPPLGVMDTLTHTMISSPKQKKRLGWNEIRADWFCRAQGRTGYPRGSEKMMGAENVHWYHLSCVRCQCVCVYVYVSFWNYFSLAALVVLCFFCVCVGPPACLSVCQCKCKSVRCWQDVCF